MDTMFATGNREDDYGQTAQRTETIQEKLAMDGKKRFKIVYKDWDGNQQQATVYAASESDAKTKFESSRNRRIVTTPGIKIPSWNHGEYEVIEEPDTE